MHYTTLFSAGLLAGLADIATAGYDIQDNYAPSDFFSMFSFFTGSDPTGGLVDYLDQGSAQGAGLLSTTANNVRWGVDSTNQAPGGRSSVRLTSNKPYNGGLFILDVAHMPTGCGTWPAFWLVGPDWPNQGEVDIIEGVNAQQTNEMTLHTGPGCSIESSGGFVGDILNTGCDVTGGDNTGCGINSTSTESYGSGLNGIQGGVYATEWAADYIAIWFFPRGSIPSDIASGNPNPSSWGAPLSKFAGGCSFSGSSSHFKDMNIVFDTTFCGQWAGQDDIFSATCPGKGSCNSYVASNPTAFADAYWEVNSLKVYSSDGGSSSDDSPSPSKPEAPINSIVSQIAAPSVSTWSMAQFQPASTNGPAASPVYSTWSMEQFQPVATPSASPSVVWLSAENFEPAATPSPTSVASAAAQPQAASTTTEERGSTTPLADGQPIPASFFGDGEGGNGSASRERRHRRHAALHRRHARDLVGVAS
ncbi:MAG: hypothetical protein M1828_005417 [Chrysothrix sp. TS-e1954]|nr:MAG: hypothetical protein M1828_005417 [Chrysothrix sp. TS-e1954]